jgi:hypothetical protein
MSTLPHSRLCLLSLRNSLPIPNLLDWSCKLTFTSESPEQLVGRSLIDNCLICPYVYEHEKPILAKSRYFACAELQVQSRLLWPKGRCRFMDLAGRIKRKERYLSY